VLYFLLLLLILWLLMFWLLTDALLVLTLAGFRTAFASDLIPYLSTQMSPLFRNSSNLLYLPVFTSIY